MASFQVVRVPILTKLPLQGWAVERTALGEQATLVTGVFPNKRDARMEAMRLRAALKAVKVPT